jgi:hypothetical protein
MPASVVCGEHLKIHLKNMERFLRGLLRMSIFLLVSRRRENENDFLESTGVYRGNEREKYFI